MSGATTLPPRRPNILLRHMYDTYRSLRYMMGVLALLLPLIIYFGHYPDPTKITLSGPKPTRDIVRGSFSAYYNSPRVGYFFIGSLFAIGTCLILYKGFTDEEDFVLNGAGIFAWGVALLPHDSDVGMLELGFLPAIRPHFVCAILLFVALWYVATFRATDTLNDRRWRGDRAHLYALGYRLFGATMLVGALAAWLLRETAFLKDVWVLVAEWVAIWAFAAFWLVKGREMEIRTGRDKAMLDTVDV